MSDPFESSGDIDAVAHEVAVALLDYVAQMDADAKLDAAVFRNARIAFNHGVLHLDRAAHRVDHAAEFDQRPIASALDGPATMHGDRRVNEIAAERPEPGQRAIFVRAGEPAVADRVGCQDRGEFAGFSSLRPFYRTQIAQ